MIHFVESQVDSKDVFRLPRREGITGRLVEVEPKTVGSQEEQMKEKKKWLVTKEQLWKVRQLPSQSWACAEKIEEHEALGNWKVIRLGGIPNGLLL